MDTIQNHNNNQLLESLNSESRQARKMWCHLCKIEFETQDKTSFQCEKCKNDFCEEIQAQIESIDDPRQFVPYGEEQVQNSNQQTNQRPQQLFQNQFIQNQNSPIRNTTQVRNLINNNARQGQPRMQYSISIQSNQPQNPLLGINSIISNLFPVTAQRTGVFGGTNDNNFENIIDFLMRNDTNVYGTPPAAENSLNNLPKIQFSKEQYKEETQCECSVCKEEFSEGEQVIKMPCNHIFHNPCLTTWLKIHNSCPTCRHELPTDNQDYERRKQERLERNNQNQTRRS